MGTEAKHYRKYGYKRDRETQLRTLADNRSDSLAMEAANQIAHLKRVAREREESIRTIHTYMLNCDPKSPIWDIVIQELDKLEEENA